jgi:hypothetical protein
LSGSVRCNLPMSLVSLVVVIMLRKLCIGSDEISFSLPDVLQILHEFISHVVTDVHTAAISDTLVYLVVTRANLMNAYMVAHDFSCKRLMRVLI